MKPTKKSKAASLLGKLGGAARAKALPPERRREISRQGNARRWGNRNPFQYLPHER